MTSKVGPKGHCQHEAVKAGWQVVISAGSNIGQDFYFTLILPPMCGQLPLGILAAASRLQSDKKPVPLQIVFL